jgi:ATP-dependent Clp protease ATP-binding subunit ClpA
MTVSFAKRRLRNTILIMTRLGAEASKKNRRSVSKNRLRCSTKQKSAYKSRSKSLPPEFLNRVDDVIVFGI